MKPRPYGIMACEGPERAGTAEGETQEDEREHCSIAQD